MTNVDESAPGLFPPADTRVRQTTLQQVRCDVLIGIVLFAVLALTRASFPQTSAIVVTSPSSGARHHVGDTVTVSWTIAEETELTGLVIDISPDLGLTYATIKQISRLARSFVWIVDSSACIGSLDSTTEIGLISDSCLIRVHDYENRSLGGVSGAFAVARRSAGSISSREHRVCTHAEHSARWGLSFATNQTHIAATGILQLNGRLIPKLTPTQSEHSRPNVGTTLVVLQE